MLRPLDDEDRSLDAAIRREYRAATTGWARAYEDSIQEGLKKHSRLTKAIVLPFASTAFRPNHTANLTREYFAELPRSDPASLNDGDWQAPLSKKRRFGESAW